MKADLEIFMNCVTHSTTIHLFHLTQRIGEVASKNGLFPIPFS